MHSMWGCSIFNQQKKSQQEQLMVRSVLILDLEIK